MVEKDQLRGREENWSPRQKGILKRLKGLEPESGYQEIVYEAAHRAYGLIPENQDPGETQELLREVTELFNQRNLNCPLPRPPEEYSSLARDIIRAVEWEASVHSASSAIIELKKLLEELRGLPFTPTGLTGAVFTITPDGTTAVNPRDWP